MRVERAQRSGQEEVIRKLAKSSGSAAKEVESGWKHQAHGECCRILHAS